MQWIMLFRYCHNNIHSLRQYTHNLGHHASCFVLSNLAEPEVHEKNSYGDFQSFQNLQF